MVQYQYFEIKFNLLGGLTKKIKIEEATATTLF